MKKAQQQARSTPHNPSLLPQHTSSDYETKEDVLDGLREAFHDVMTGNVYPVSILDELERQLGRLLE